MGEGFMSYCTIDDMLLRDSAKAIANLTGGSGTTFDTAAVELAIATAQAEVDSYIAGRVRLPLADAEVSQAVRRYTAIIARYFLYGDQKTDAVIDEYERAISWLRDVSAGRASCGVTQAPEPGATVQGSTIVAPVRKPTFGAGFESRYGVPVGPNGSGNW